jgi:hypothetical protein
MKFNFLLLIFLLKTGLSQAQKTVDIQVGNIWLSKAKIDGDLTEWGKPLKAFNKATHCWYSMANDDKNLYLAIRSNRKMKIFGGGITLSIEKASITFPYNPKRDRRKPENNVIKAGDPRILSDFKEIYIAGIAAVGDSLISIYNQYGIRVMIQETLEKDEERFYDYELAVPLQLLNLANTTSPFNYSIKINGIIHQSGRPFPMAGSTTAAIPGKTQKEMREIEDAMNDLFAVSELKGKYTPAMHP